jgi:hypothetical protein
LPAGSAGDDGRSLKQAIDDFIVGHGEAAFRRWVQEQRTEPRVRSLPEWRQEMLDARLGPEGRLRRGAFLDTSPPGAGKSYADAEALRRYEELIMTQKQECGEVTTSLRRVQSRTLTLVPTHSHCQEVVARQTRSGLAVAAYPKLDSHSCYRFAEARATQRRGLSFRLVLCPKCPHRDDCPFRQQLQAASEARHAVATYARAALSIDEMAAMRPIISLHEAPLDALRPSFVTSCGLPMVEVIARQAEHAARRPAHRAFYRHLARVAQKLHGWLEGSNESAKVPLPDAARHEPQDLHWALNEACLELGGKVPSEAMRLALAAALGQLSCLAVGVDERRTKGGEVELSRTLVGVVKNNLPKHAALWLSDATGSSAELESLLEREPTDRTPQGRLLLHHPVLQIVPARDVTKKRAAKKVLPILRGLLHDLPYKRIGLLTHKELAFPLRDLLEPPYSQRLAQVSHFGSGLSRGSNSWIGDAACDALIVLGTPRVGSDAIRAHNLRLGKTQAALLTQEKAGWSWDWWSGVTESGRRKTTRCWHYRNHDWHAAYCSLVRDELLQAIGRGRGILPEGIPVFVVTTENLSPSGRTDGQGGPPLADHPFSPLSETQLRVLGALHREEPRRVRDLASTLGLSTRRVRVVLNELLQARRVQEMRRSWILAPPPWNARNGIDSLDSSSKDSIPILAEGGRNRTGRDGGDEEDFARVLARVLNRERAERANHAAS